MYEQVSVIAAYLQFVCEICNICPNTGTIALHFALQFLARSVVDLAHRDMGAGSDPNGTFPCRMTQTRPNFEPPQPDDLGHVAPGQFVLLAQSMCEP